ncbi:hypothetical protein Tco_0423436, partial [Tanacetum coccineum]
SSNIEFVYTKGDDGDVMFIEIIKQSDVSHKEEPEVDENAGVEELERDVRRTLKYHATLDMCMLRRPTLILTRP